MADDPTIYGWAGGTAAFRRLRDGSYDRVEADDCSARCSPAALMGDVERGARPALSSSAPDAAVVEQAPVPRWG